MNRKPLPLMGRDSKISVLFPAGMSHRIGVMDVLWPRVFRAGGLVGAGQQRWELGPVMRRGLAQGHPETLVKKHLPLYSSSGLITSSFSYRAAMRLGER
jgi:hypothetical protein